MRRDVRSLVLASIASALAILPLALLAYKAGPAVHLDDALLRHLSAPEGSARYELADAFTGLFNLLPYLALVSGTVALGLLARRTRETIAAVAILAGANLTTQLLKHLLEHPRVVAGLGFGQPWANSFPSGHTTAAASLAVALVLVVAPRLRPAVAAVGALVTVTVGVGLVVISAHYPSDVLGALLVVGSWSFAAIAALRAIRPRRPERRTGSETATGRFAISMQ